MMKSSFTRREVEEFSDLIINEKDFTKELVGNENKMAFKNEFSNNIKANWYLTKELKKSLKNQEKLGKKRRCLGLKGFTIDTKACQCRLF